MFCVVGNNNSSNSAAVSFPSLRLCCNLQHRNTVKCQTMVVKEEEGGGVEWREANMQLFLIESAQSGQPYSAPLRLGSRPLVVLAEERR